MVIGARLSAAARNAAVSATFRMLPPGDTELFRKELEIDRLNRGLIGEREPPDPQPLSHRWHWEIDTDMDPAQERWSILP